MKMDNLNQAKKLNIGLIVFHQPTIKANDEEWGQ